MSNLEQLISELEERSDKQLRTLRNNINNRLTSFQNESRFGKNLKELQVSHPLYGLEHSECKELLEHVSKELRRRKFQAPTF